MRALWRTVLLLVLSVLIASSAAAAEIKPVKLVLGLDECIGRALTSAPELGESRADVELAEARLDEAKAHRYPQIEITGLVGPAPQARGNQIYSPDRYDSLKRITVFERGEATIIQPLYTFGKISERMKAATHGISVNRARKDQKNNEIALKVKEYYYGLLLARELREVVSDIGEALDKARSRAKKLLDKGSANVDALDIYKLDAFSGEVKKYWHEAKKGESLALAALRTQIGLPQGEPFDIATARLTADAPRKLDDYPAFVDKAREKRPEYKQLKEGLDARAALVNAAKADYYPDFFVGGHVSGAHAAKRNRVSNPWIQDNFNHLWGGVALGVKWKLDFGITSAKIAQEQAQYKRLLSTSAYAEANIPLQINKAYLEMQEAQKSIAATKEAYTNAKKWAVAALANFDMGVGPAKEIFDSLQSYAKMRSDYFQSIYNYRMSLANLTYAVGEAKPE